MGNILLVKHKKWLSKSCGVVISVIICFSAIVYTQYNNASQSTLFNLNGKKRKIVQGASFGNSCVTGVARIVRTLADCDVVQSGDIMVAVMTTDEWLGAMKRCAGIITNGGGSMCHSALFGKQYGIPVIVGTGNATEKIANGDIIALECSGDGVGTVYNATQNDLSYQHEIVTPFQVPTVANQSVDGSTVSEYKPTHNQHYYYQYDGELSHHRQEDLVGQSEMQEKQYVTQEMFNQHYSCFIADIVSTKNKYWWGKKTRTIEIGAAAQGCDEFSIKCIPVADDFFSNLSESEIRLMVKLLPSKYLHYINTLINRCNSKPGDMNWISRVSHEEHIRKISLPADINKEELIEDPTKYKKIIDQKMVDMRERHFLIAAGLFARYWCEKKIKA